MDRLWVFSYSDVLIRVFLEFKFLRPKDFKGVLQWDLWLRQDVTAVLKKGFLWVEECMTS
jgi:hypothetical protein